MRISPERILRFVQNARLSLQLADVKPHKVISLRIPQPPAQLPSTRRLLSIASSPSQPSDESPPSTFSKTATELEHDTVFATGETPILPGNNKNEESSPAHQARPSKPLPRSCPGCGALSQRVDPGQAGYYKRSRHTVQQYLRGKRKDEARKDTSTSLAALTAALEAEVSGEPIPEQTDRLENLHQEVVRSNGVLGSAAKELAVPMCDRCHYLVHQSRGVSISHPSIDSIADSIAESPFRRNHVFHVMDAADFPMSLMPSIHKTLNLAKPRSPNRRSQHDFSSKPTLSFVITRSDLLTRTKEGVDALMPYFISVLRTALGRHAADIRLGNVHLVSANRGWWTRDIKKSMWNRGGGNWMVGKVNVGKSKLFEVLFPKGSGERAPSYAELKQEAEPTSKSLDTWSNSYVESNEILSETLLLPPVPPETPFPAMPLVSNLPGTTASPIRLSFGNHKGELVDLPGLARGDLENFVHPDHKLDLVMQSRPTVSQHTIKPGQSLLLGGGLVRITPMLDPTDPSNTMLIFPFVPIEAHRTSTEKAIGEQRQDRQSGIKSILAEGAGEKIKSAGVFTLRDDVTRARAAPLLNAGVLMEKLPFRVFATDLLIEGVGWVELVCQVRRRPGPAYVAPKTLEGDALSHLDDPPPKGDFEIPQVEVFTPEGKHIGQRKTMGARAMWEESARLVRKKRSLNSRPRKPMAGAKKREKMERGMTAH